MGLTSRIILGGDGLNSNPYLQFIQTKQNFPSPVSGVIFLDDNTTYFITTTVDLQGDRLVGGVNTAIIGGFYYNGVDAVYYYAGTNSKNPTLLGKSAITNLPDDEALTVSFGLQNGEAVAKTMSVDYILASKER